MRKIILASASPHRREILELLDIPFVQEESGFEEDMTLKMSPENLVKYLALGKARAVAARHDNAIVIGADTVVVIGKKILGKPLTVERTREFLRALSGRTHKVLTGLAVIDMKTGKKVSKAEATKIWFRRLSRDEIERYVASKESLHNAGGYRMQGRGGIFVKKIEGDYYNIVGLPLSTLQDVLQRLGISREAEK